VEEDGQEAEPQLGHWLKLIMPSNALDSLRAARFVLGLHVHGTGLGWPPSEVNKLPISEINYHCEQIDDLWSKMK
jgi:hypothetical protein